MMKGEREKVIKGARELGWDDVKRFISYLTVQCIV